MSRGKRSLMVALVLLVMIANSKIAGAFTLARPGPNQLLASIENGNCLISSGARDQIARLLHKLDTTNLGLLVRAGVATVEPEDMRSSILAKTGDLPSRIPECPRNLIYGLRLQVDMLELLAEARGIANRKSYRAHRVMDPETEAVYGDFRDGLIGYLYTPLDEINSVMTILDSRPRPRVAMPVNIKSYSLLEKRYIEDLTRVVDLALDDNLEKDPHVPFDKAESIEHKSRSPH